MSIPQENRLNYWKHWLALTILTLLVALPGLSNLPVIDRDEARFAQASVQMAESGDLINIRFQDEARHKKPAGIYWLQTGAIKLFRKTGERDIWVQRLPSVLGALLAVLMTYWGAVRMIGRRGAFIAASLLSLSALIVFEAHIAKTDAVLCGLGAACFAALAHLRNGESTLLPSWIFWTALGASIMIKGPVIPLLIILTLTTLAIWERGNGWMKSLLNWPAIILFILMWLPWAIIIWMETKGTFFSESLGKDFGGKIISAQEKHSGPPGYYLGTIWITLWPACLLLIPGLVFAVRAVKKNKGSNAPVIKAMRLCLAWIIPYWVLVEIMPTKLPHYILPLFPALCTLMGAAAIMLLSTDRFQVARRINAGLFLIASTIIISVVMAASGYYGDVNYIYYGLGTLSGICAIAAVFALWRNNMKLGLISAGLSSLMLTVPTYALILPNLTQLRTTDSLVKAFDKSSIALPRRGNTEVVSPDFTEPSLVYHMGTNIDISGQADILNMAALKSGRVILLDQEKDKAKPRLAMLKAHAHNEKICLDISHLAPSFNYSKGKAVKMLILQSKECEAVSDSSATIFNETPDE